MAYREYLVPYGAESNDLSSFAQTCYALAADARTNPADWSTTDLADYLELVGYWAANEFPKVHRNLVGDVPPTQPTWQIIADILRAVRQIKD